MLGRCRYFVKKEIVRIPFFGWAFWVRHRHLILFAKQVWTGAERILGYRDDPRF